MDVDEDRSSIQKGAREQYSGFRAMRISQEEYQRQSREETKAAVEELQRSSEFQRFVNTCSSCGACWYDGHVSQGCEECGAGTMVIPCPICQGSCGRTFTRDATSSHSFKEAHWDGECALPAAEQQRRLFLLDSQDPDDLADAVMDLAS